MKKHTSFVAAVAVMASLQVAVAADVVGTVTLKGTPPPEKELPLDPQCGQLHAGKPKPKTRFYTTNDKGGLADVFVSVKGVTGKSAGASATPLLIDQQGCEYLPYVAAAQTGQKVLVRNSDPVLHNVHATPTVAGNKEVNKAQLPKSPDLEFVFEKPEPFLRFKCDVHPWMFAYINVVDHPYFSVSDKDGKYKITGLAPGKYTIEASHRKGGTVSQEIEVKDTGATLDFTIEVK